jgi:hypothetical protein
MKRNASTQVIKCLGSVLAFVLFCTFSWATTYTFQEISDDEWNNPANWTPSYPGLTIAAGDVVLIPPGEGCDIDGITVTNYGTITIQANDEASGSIFIRTTGALLNHGAFVQEEGSFFSLCGNVKNVGLMEFHHFMDMGCGGGDSFTGTLRNEGELIVDAFLENYGFIQNEEGGLLKVTIKGTLFNTRAFFNKGEVVNMGIVSQSIGASGWTPPFENWGVFKNENNADFINGFNNNGLFINNGSLHISGNHPEDKGFNYGTLRNNGAVTITTGNEFIHQGALLENNGTMEAITHKDGLITGTGLFEEGLTNGNTLRPGLPGAVGTLTVDDTYSNNRRILSIRLQAGGSNDKLVVNGPAIIAGTLKITVDNPGGLVPGSIFTILESTSLDPTYGTFDVLDAPLCCNWQLLYDYPNTGDVSLEYVADELLERSAEAIIPDQLVTPNPARQFLSFHLDAWKGYPVSLRLIDMEGSVLWQYHLDEVRQGEYQLNLLDLRLPAGYYQALIQSKRGTETELVLISPAGK